MLTMTYNIKIGQYYLGMLDSVEIHRSVELLADTAIIKLPASERNKVIGTENMIKRGDAVIIMLGYEETGVITEFTGYLQEISTDDGSLTLHCEDNLFLFRKPVKNHCLKNVKLVDLIKLLISDMGLSCTLSCSYEWTYKKFLTHDTTGYEVLKKLQDEVAADIYLDDKNVLHVHGRAEKVGNTVNYDFSRNVEKSDLTYRSAEDKKYKIIVKSVQPDGTIKKLELGSSEGDSKEIQCTSNDSESMKLRGEQELKRLSFDGFDGSFTTWLVPYITSGDKAVITDKDYPSKNGGYYVNAVTTVFSEEGGSRKVELGIKLTA